MILRLVAIVASLCLAQEALRAETPAGGNPYAPIAERNVFGLLPIPTNPPVENTAPAGLPKITLNGIQNIFGKMQAIFKVAAAAGAPRPMAAPPGQPGQPAPQPPNKDQSYMLAEGERQDDIEVVKINEAEATVTFNNHGTVQTLTLQAAGGAGGAGGVTNRPPVQLGGLNRLPPPAVPAPSGMVNDKGIYQPGGTPAGAAAVSSMTPEQRILAIEAMRARYRQTGDPRANILPPTPMTPQPGDDGGDGDQ